MLGLSITHKHMDETDIIYLELLQRIAFFVLNELK